jgi:hypothetical protein
MHTALNEKLRLMWRRSNEVVRMEERALSPARAPLRPRARAGSERVIDQHFLKIVHKLHKPPMNFMWSSTTNCGFAQAEDRCCDVRQVNCNSTSSSSADSASSRPTHELAQYCDCGSRCEVGYPERGGHSRAADGLTSAESRR